MSNTTAKDSTPVSPTARHLQFLEAGKLCDVRFHVGVSTCQRVIVAHKLILAMASPVFERMFYGSSKDRHAINDPEAILDLQHEAFKKMIDFIYTGEVTVNSFNEASALYSAGHKYMIDYLCKHCLRIIEEQLSPQTACRAYEFAELFKLPKLKEKAFTIIIKQTSEVLAEPNFADIEISTLNLILNQSVLNIKSELELFNGIMKIVKEHGLFENAYIDESKNVTAQLSGANSCKGVVNVAQLIMAKRQKTNQEKTCRDTDTNKKLVDEISNSVVGPVELSTCSNDNVSEMHNGSTQLSTSAKETMQQVVSSKEAEMPENIPENILPDVTRNVLPEPSISTEKLVQVKNECGNAAMMAVKTNTDVVATQQMADNAVLSTRRAIITEAMIREAVKSVRFGTFSPRQFAEGPAQSNILSPSEKNTIFISLCCIGWEDYPMPDGFSTNNFLRTPFVHFRFFCHKCCRWADNGKPRLHTEKYSFLCPDCKNYFCASEPF